MSIKFKVWDEKKSKWFDETHSVLDANGRMWVRDGGEFPDRRIEDNYIFFSTRLTDKNDKEIYAGDIVKFKEKTYEISQSVHGTWLMKEVNEKYVLYDFLNEVEVIGNIKENSGLLATT